MDRANKAVVPLARGKVLFIVVVVVSGTLPGLRPPAAHPARSPATANPFVTAEAARLLRNENGVPGGDPEQVKVLTVVRHLLRDVHPLPADRERDV